MTKEQDIVERLLHLVSLNEPNNGGPYQGFAAQACMAAMREAAQTIAALRAERDAMREKAISNARERNAAEARIKILQQSFDDAFEQRNIAIRERDELRKALEPNAAILARASSN